MFQHGSSASVQLFTFLCFFHHGAGCSTKMFPSLSVGSICLSRTHDRHDSVNAIASSHGNDRMQSLADDASWDAAKLAHNLARTISFFSLAPVILHFLPACFSSAAQQPVSPSANRPHIKHPTKQLEIIKCKHIARCTKLPALLHSTNP